jgi:hypothetical protein
VLEEGALDLEGADPKLKNSGTASLKEACSCS